MFLSPDELFDLTGYRRAADQRRWLDFRRWTYEIRGDGRPAVLRAHAEIRLGGSPETACAGTDAPDFSAM